jgi:HSP20 family molecular chaperone IbpA
MKAAVTAGRGVSAQKNVRAASRQASLRERVAFSDLTDCLLSAYDGVARLAYEKFVVRATGFAGNELEDWLEAESELLGQMDVNISDCGDFLSVLASVPGYRGAQISLGLESRWILVFARSATQDRVDVPQMVHSFDPLRAPPHIDAESLATLCAHAAREQSYTRVKDRGTPAANLFCISELPAEVEPASCEAIVSNGLLGVRIAKVRATARNPGVLLLAP